MNNEKERKVLVLIPSLREYVDDMETMHALSTLRNELNLVISFVSETISKLIYNEFNNLNNFLARFGIPKISLNLVEACNDISLHSGVRICLTKYNDMVFCENFILDKAKYKEYDISHIIELEINDSVEKPKWRASNFKDSSGNIVFDAKVITNTSSLYDIVLSLMIDMYSYYIAGLSQEFESRAVFSDYKIQYIDSIMTPEIKEIYSIKKTEKAFPENVNYIPISLRHNPNKNKLMLSETVKDFQQIAFNYIISKNKCRIVEEKFIYDESAYNDTEKAIISKAFNHVSSDEFVWFAVYSPLTELLGIGKDKTRQQKLVLDIENYLRDNSINLYHIKDTYYFYVEQQTDTIFPLFSYFKWFNMDCIAEEGEDNINE